MSSETVTRFLSRSELGQALKPAQLSATSSPSMTASSTPLQAVSTPASSIHRPGSKGECRDSLLEELPALSLDSLTVSEHDPSAAADEDNADHSDTSDGEQTLVGTKPARRRRASTALLSTDDDDQIRKLLGTEKAGSSLIQKCCGGGCRRLSGRPLPLETPGECVPVTLPDNAAFASLNLASRLSQLALDTKLTNVLDLPAPTVSIEPAAGPVKPSEAPAYGVHPPPFVQPHPPNQVFSAPVHHARELTKPGAQKRTIHFDIDVTDYPDEGTGIDFKVGGAIGICPRNSDEVVADILNCLGVPAFLRDTPILLKTGPIRWPTIWGEEEERELLTTRREVLMWCSDVQSTPPTKPLLRLLAEHATNEHEKKILTFLVADEGQGVFCDMRTGPHLTTSQLLHAFPSSQPPLAHLLSVLGQLMPRFYSLSNDPHVSSSSPSTADSAKRRIIEIAITVHTDDDWSGSTRTGVGSGFMSRLAEPFINGGGQKGAAAPRVVVPMFRGLMANPLSREFASDGPMILIGAGVGVAPFRGFILNRLRRANCANKIWLIQGIRDASLDQLYEGELGPETVEKQIKYLVQSRNKSREVAEARYVQDEVRHQADTVWDVINAVDGRIFVCGSTCGMGEGVKEALVDVVRDKASLSREEAEEFWKTKEEGGQYISETW